MLFFYFKFMGLIDRVGDFFYKARDYDRLKREYDDFRKRDSEMVEAAKESLAECQRLYDSSRMTRREIIEIAKLRTGYSDALEQWKKAEVYPSKRELVQLKDEVVKLRRERAVLDRVLIGYTGKFFSRDMELLLATNPEFTTIPFYYNGVGRSPPVYTPAFSRLFTSNLGVSEEQLRNLTLINLLGYVEEGKRKELERVFFHGERLKNYGFKTIGNNPKILLIGRSYPVYHKHFKNGRVPIGIGLFFIDPESIPSGPFGFSQKKEEVRKIARFGKKLLETVEKTTDELYVFSEVVREDDIPRSIDEIPVSELY